ncbi:hypothetical protein SK224_15445 [Microbacterium sp. BG28]|uniref:hypothetical protein n=1 Tax=Microbacterium sp. BG28 TaxID=3097356 RepID=UPI002A599823|nr:hypothetical protein [Microbacterium sp. BG28]MDY0830528.1 hypothetical protein [Microbacterium sp. BG28]
MRSVADAAARDDIRGRCEEYAPRMRPWQFFGGETALALYGAPLPEWPHATGIHVCAHRPAREPRIAGVTGHRLQHREPATREHAGLAVEHPARAWRQAATTWRVDDLICAAEFLVSGSRPLSSAAELRDEIEAMGDVRGRLSAALRDVRSGARSPRETRLRLLLQRGGLPEPDINWTLYDPRGRHVAELDLAYRRWRIGVEYDGRVRAQDARQFAKDADRWDAIRAEGWELVRILNHHMRGDGRVAVDKVRQALARAGWRQ